MSEGSFSQSKAAGLAAFSSGSWKAAKSAYLQAASTEAISAANKAIVLCNAAACCLKLAEFNDAERLASDSLAARPDYVKALYRRSQVSLCWQQGSLHLTDSIFVQAYAAQGQGSAALADLDRLLCLEPANSAATRLARAVISGEAAAAGAAASASSIATPSPAAGAAALAAVTATSGTEAKVEVALQHLTAAASQAAFKDIAPILAGTLQNKIAAASFAFGNGISAAVTAPHAEPMAVAGLLRLLLRGAGASPRSRLQLLQALAKAAVASAWFKPTHSGGASGDWATAGVGLYGSVLHFYAHGEGSEVGQAAAAAADAAQHRRKVTDSDPEVDALRSLRRFAVPALVAVLKGSPSPRCQLAALEGITAALASPGEAEVLLATGALRVLVAATAAVDGMGEAAESSPPPSSASHASQSVSPEAIPRAAQSALATLLQHLRRSQDQSTDAVQERVRGMLLSQCQHALRSMGGGEGGGSAWDLAQEEEQDEAVKQAVSTDQKAHERAERRRMAEEKRRGGEGGEGGVTESKQQGDTTEEALVADAASAGTAADPRLAQLREREERRVAALATAGSSAARDPALRVDALEAERALKLLHTGFLTHADAALSLLQRASFRSLLLAAGRSARTPTQVAMADLVSVVVGDKEGGGDAIVSQPLLALLGELAAARTLSLRSAATVALAKLTSGSMVSKPGVGLNGLPAGGDGGDSDSAAQAEATAAQGKAKREALASVYMATSGLLAAAAELLPQLASAEAQSTEGGSAGAGATTMAGAGAVVARAVESLSVIVGHTSVKHAIMQDQGTLRCVMQLLHALGHGVAVPPSRAQALSGRSTTDKAPAMASSMDVATRFAALCGGSPTLLGGAYILYALATSVDEQRTAALAQMELDPETWEKFQQLTSSGGGGVDEPDPPEAVQARVKALVSMEGSVRDASCAEADAATGAGGVGGPDRVSRALTIVGVMHGLHAMVEQLAAAAGAGRQPDPKGAKEGSAAAHSHTMAGRSIMVNELLARCALGLTSPQEKPLRGRLVQLGMLGLLLNLSEGKKNTNTGRIQAAQALARVLISTNPGLLPDAQLHDCIAPLVFLARVLEAPPPNMLKKSASTGRAQGTSFDAHTGSVSLQRFEACLALTNLASHGAATQRILIAAGALGALESLQFDRNALVRRAATEGITNLATTDAGRAVIAQRSLSLWCALASAYWEDEVTAIAAAGGLAMATATQYDLSEREVKSEGVHWVASAEEAAANETALHDAGRQAARAVLAGDGVKSMAGALLSGIADLQHRALVVLRNLLYVPGGAEALSGAVVIDISFAQEGESPQAAEGAESKDGAAAVPSADTSSQSTVEVVPIALLAAMAQGAELPSWTQLQQEEKAGGTPTGTQQTTSPVLKQLAGAICDIVKAQLQDAGNPAGYV